MVASGWTRSAVSAVSNASTSDRYGLKTCICRLRPEEGRARPRVGAAAYGLGTLWPNRSRRGSAGDTAKRPSGGRSGAARRRIRALIPGQEVVRPLRANATAPPIPKPAPIHHSDGEVSGNPASIQRMIRSISFSGSGVLRNGMRGVLSPRKRLTSSLCDEFPDRTTAPFALPVVTPS